MSTLEFRKLSDREVETCERNLADMGLKFRYCRKKCGNPFCGFPLAPLVTHNYVPVFGDVCELCHSMYSAVKVRPGMVDAHEKWEKEQAQKRRMLDEDKYFDK